MDEFVCGGESMKTKKLGAAIYVVNASHKFWANWEGESLKPFNTVSEMAKEFPEVFGNCRTIKSAIRIVKKVNEEGNYFMFVFVIIAEQGGERSEV